MSVRNQEQQQQHKQEPALASSKAWEGKVVRNPNNLPADDFALVAALVDAALAKGYSVSIYDGEAWTVKRSTDRAELMAAIGTTDMDTLRIRNACGAAVGSVLTVYGNGDWSTIADSSVSPEIEALTDAAERAAGCAL